jgi:lysozyme
MTSPVRKNRFRTSFMLSVIMFTVLFSYRYVIHDTALKLFRTHIRGMSKPRASGLAEREKIARILKHYDEHLFGIDVSQYQGSIDWSKVEVIDDSVQIGFVICRATIGSDLVDSEYDRNWQNAMKKNLVRGAYHYYRPNENSIKQAVNFIAQVELGPGDLPPILDIEALPEIQSIDNLKVGLKRWLDMVEAHYGVKPIIYSGDHYFQTHLEEAPFDEYPIWIANYSQSRNPRRVEWVMWQFTEQGRVPGIGSHVDLNVLAGGTAELQALQIK